VVTSSVVSVLVAIAFPVVTLSQSVTGALRGSVTGESGAPLAAVAVMVSSPSLQGERQFSTDGKGNYHFASLPAGRYSVHLRRIGYTPQRVTDVDVHLGSTTALEPIVMRPQGVQLNEIVVSGARAIVDPTTAASATVLDSARFRVLPTGRDYTSMIALAPQGGVSPYGDGVMFGGATGYDNKFFIDGIHTSNPLSSDGSIRLPYNFIKEIQVVTGGYEAEFGRSQGAVVNVVTNSGGNDFHGEAVTFYTGNNLRSTPRWGIAERPVDRFTHYDVGLSFGGPIRRDRLWFYVAANPLVEEKDVSFSGVPTDRDRLVRNLFAGKLTWRPASGADVTLTVIGDPTSRDAVEGAEAWTAPLTTVKDPRVVRGAYRDGGWATSLQWHQLVSSRLQFAAALSRLTNVHQVAQRDGPNDFASVARIDDYAADASLGNFGRSYHVNTSRTAAEASMTVLGVRHTVMVGGNYEYNAIHLPYFRESFIGHNPDGTWSWFASSWAGRGHSAVPTVYAQDSWALTDRVRLNFGVRVEGQFIAGDTGRGMSISRELAPRLGIVFQPGVLGSQKIVAFAGRFYEQLPLWPVSALTMPFEMLIGTYPQNPLVDRSGAEEISVKLGSIAAADRNLRGQHYDEFAVGYERRFGRSDRVGLRGMTRILRMALESDNTAQDPENPDYGILGLLGNPGRGRLAYLPRGSRRHSSFEFTFDHSGPDRLQYAASYILSRTYGNLNGEFDSDRRVPASHTQGQTADPNWWTHSTGYLPSDRRHLVKLSGSYRMSEDLTMGTAAVYGSGLPLSEYQNTPLGVVHASKRGTNGRTPSTWSVDLRWLYDVPRVASRWRPTVSLDLFNVGNQRRAIDFDQVHFVDPQLNTNPNYLKVNKYQAPLRARLGIIVGF
jgi:hypothetical protein